MGLLPLITAAALLPALFVLISYSVSFARPIEDPEIKARRRWRMINRGNAVWLLVVVVGLVAIAEVPSPNVHPAGKAAASLLFIVITYCPFIITVGIVDRKIRDVRYRLSGYLRFQFAFFFCRWSSILVVVAFLFVPLSFADGRGGISYTGITLAAAGAVMFVVVALFQMRMAGRVAGMLAALDPDQEPAKTVGELAARAGISGVRVFVMETFGYPFFNAFAAPGRIIYVTRPVLSALTRDDFSAVAAHEIGHLVTMKTRTALILTILTGCVIASWFLVGRLAALVSGGGSLIFEIAATLVFLILAIFFLGALSRRFETRADQTAAGLMGGAEKVISALEKIYSLNMVPRRFDRKGSENASHPSLERRVAVLRGESLPRRVGRVRRIVFLLAAIAIVLTAILVIYTRGFERTSGNGPNSQYSWVDVIGPLEDRLAVDPDNFEVLKRLAVEYFLMEEDERALDKIDRALALKSDPGLLTLRGILLNFRGDRAGALSAMEEASREGKSTLALKWAAIMADGVGDKERARTYIAEIATIRPDDPFIREMKERSSGGTVSYPFVGYSVVFQHMGAVPISPKHTEEE